MSPLTEPTRIVLKNYNTPAAIAGVAPTLDYRFALDRRELDAVSLTDKLTVTRAATAAVNGPTGYLDLAGANVARFDHDPATGESLGLLIEESRTNLVIYSENFENWSANGTRSTVTPNQIIAPDGTLSGDMINDSNLTTGLKNLYLYVTVTGNVTYTGSIYVKAGTSDWINFSFDDSLISFQFSTETISLDPNAPTGATAGFENAGNGWYRIYVKDINASTGSRPISLWTGASSQTYNQSYTGDPTKTVYVWGAQLEEGSFPTSYIPTTGSIVTRTESATIDGTGVITGTYTMVEKPTGCAVVNGTNIDLQTGYTAERVMVFPAALSSEQITAIRSVM